MNKKILLTLVLLAGLTFSGSIAHAEKNHVATTQKINMTSSTDADVLVQTLRRGMKNNSVLMLQKKLKNLGYYEKSLDADYGLGTKAAVMKFQAAYGLNPDGVVGPKTFAKILYKTGLLSKTDNMNKNCTAEYAPVCAEKEGAEPKTYSNYCEAKKVGAKKLYIGKCGSEDAASKKERVKNEIKKLENEIDQMKQFIEKIEGKIKDLEDQL